MVARQRWMTPLTNTSTLHSCGAGTPVDVYLQVGADGGEAALAAWPAGRPAPDAAFAAVATYLTGQGLTPAQVL